jgi:hypothetical protein
MGLPATSVGVSLFINALYQAQDSLSGYPELTQAPDEFLNSILHPELHSSSFLHEKIDIASAQMTSIFFIKLF